MKSDANSDRAQFPEIELSQPLAWNRVLMSNVMYGIAFLLTGIALLPLLAILLEIVRRGFPHFKWIMLVALPAPVGLDNLPNGFANAIVGTLILVTIATLFSVPVGVLTAVFLTEFGRGTKVAKLIRFTANVLSGVPSIVVGIFGYGVVVLSTIAGYRGFSALAGGFSLSVIMLPIIILTTESALQLVPVTLRLASSALGSNRFETTFRVIIPAALPAITTGILLAVARASGETAPLIFTALFSQGWPTGLLSPTPSLSVLIYNYAGSPFLEQNNLAWTASLVLVTLVLLVNILSRLVTRSRLKTD